MSDPVLDVVDKYLRDLQKAIAQGDRERFRVEMFDPGTNRVRHEVAMNLRYGLRSPRDGGSTARTSLGEQCLMSNQLGLFRQALEAEPPELMQGLVDGGRTQWYRFLCTRFAHGAVARVSLGNLAALEGYPQSRDFIELHLEMEPQCASISQLEFADVEAAARINEARMSLRIRQAGQATGEEAGRASVKVRRSL